MAQWFPTLDAAVGGTADAIEDSGDWVLGGIGSTVGDAVEGTGDVVGGAAGGLLGGIFAPFMQTWLIALGLVLGAVVLIRVI